MNRDSLIKESFYYTLIYYLGAGIGVFSTIFIYPSDLELYGLYGFLTNSASLFTPFITLGFGAVLLRYFPYHSKEHKGGAALFAFVGLGYLVGMMLFILVFIVLGKRLVSWMPAQDPVILESFLWLAPLTLVYVFYDLIQMCSINHQRIAFPSVLVNSFKLILPVIFLITSKSYMSHEVFIGLIVLYYLVISVLLIRYIHQINPDFFRWDWTLIKHKDALPMYKFAAFNIISGVASVLALRTDALMVGSMMGAQFTGVYVLFLFISNAVFIPAQSLNEILNPGIARLMRSNEEIQVEQYYRKSAIHMMLPTLILSFLIWSSFEVICLMMPNGSSLLQHRTALGFLLLARVIDAATGINHHIINYSRFFRMESMLLVLLAVSNIALNLLFIPKMGLSGAALGTLTAVGLYNMLKSLYIFFRLGMHPISRSWFLILGSSFILFILTYRLSLIEDPYYSGLFKNLMVLFVFGLIVFYTSAAQELKQWVLSKIVKCR